MNAKSSTGLAKFGGILTIAIFAAFLLSFAPQSTTGQDNGLIVNDHIPTITIDPEVANCGNIPSTFTVNIANDGSYGIYNVKIYKDQINVVSLICGDAPAGWQNANASGGLMYDLYCEYTTNPRGPDVINATEDLDFTFDATVEQVACESTFTVTTLDNEAILTGVGQGREVQSNVSLAVDCSDPEIIKTVGDPKIAGEEPVDWWITQNTNLGFESIDNQDVCDLGIDYCRWRVTIDGGDPGSWNIVKDGETLNWDVSYVEDSNHYIEVECVDRAGNEDTLEELDKVDDTPPVTTKTFIGPQKIDGLVEWIDGITTIELTAEDPDLTTYGCNIGVDKTWYTNVMSREELACSDPASYCRPIVEFPYEQQDCIDGFQEWCEEVWDDSQYDYNNWYECVEGGAHGECFVDERWHLYDGTPIEKDEESCHIFQYFSVDELGNVENMSVNCFFVDKTPPVGEKTIGEPNIPCSDDESVIGDELVLTLENKNSEWQIINDNMQATLVYNDMGPEFEYSLTATGLLPQTEYSLIYYADFDPRFDIWGGNNPGALITTVTTDEIGNIPTTISDSTNLGMSLPSSPDWNINPDPNYCNYANGFDNYAHCTGAKIWLVPSTDYSEPGLTAWNPDNYLFETDLIDYTFAECFWVQDHVTPITLTCEDQLPHPSGDEEVCYKVSYDIEPYDRTDQYCPEGLELIENQGEYDGDWCCIPSPKEIIFVEDSLHDLEYFCRDAVDKKSEIDLEWFRVDSQPPIITKIMIGDDHLGYDATGALSEEACPPRPGMGDTCYVADNDENGVRIDVVDGGDICAVDSVICDYKLLWGDKTSDECNTEGYGFYGEYPGYPGEPWCLVEGGQFDEKGLEISFKEDSTHVLEIQCEDALGNKMNTDVEEFLVDSTPPETTKTYNPDAYVDDNQWEYIDTVHEVILEATDEKVGVDKIRYRVSGSLADDFCQSCGTWMDRMRPNMGDWQPYTGPFNGMDESCHVIEYSSIDKLGNEEEINWQCVFVDKTPPVTEKIISPNPYFDDNQWEYIDTAHTITLGAVDPDPHPSGVAETQYRVSGALADKFCEPVNCDNWMTSLRPDMGDWQPYTDSFGIDEESCHVIEYRSIDNVGKTEDIKWQCVFVDKQAPIIEKEYIGPQKNDEIEGSIVEWIDGVTLVNLTVTDPDPHPSGVALVEYRVTQVDESNCWSNDLCSIAKVDGGWNIYTEPFGDIPESCHLIEVHAVDNVGKEATHKQCVFVDKTPPGIEKWYGEPFESYQFDTYWAKWISVETPIYATITDDGPHMSGIKEVKYRTERVNDEDCKYLFVDNGNDLVAANGDLNYDCSEVEGSVDWTIVDPAYYSEFEFNINEESCHLIEIMATDNVDKCALHKQWVYVDDTAPDPVKIVEEPKTVWNPVDAATDPLDPDATHFYPEIVDKCRIDPEEKNSCTAGEGCIDCWKVTTMTSIILNCSDPDPHPVDHEKIWFKVELDGDDYTETYCEKIGGVYEEGFYDDEYYCLITEVEAPVTFHFTEISEHNLKYYCEDALGNVGPVDDEKFKVEDGAFKIQINKKWNLISTPFVLLDNSIDEVFEDIAEDVESVWTYDATTGEWYIYTPDGVENDNLDTMVPGWGYWVLAHADNDLIIGGSLLSPINLPPSKPIANGWNLIGYYGNNLVVPPVYDEWAIRDYYSGPVDDGAPTTCMLGSLVDTTFGYPKWSSLFTYWELDNPDLWKFLGYNDNMDPGAGYWVNVDLDPAEVESYDFSTTCPGIFF